MALLNDNDILFAQKALLLMPGLSDATKRVAGAILDHFNKRTGQCDPSVDRLATMLGMDRSSVMRATEKLHSADLIEKIRHGGNSHRTCYLPNWERFNALVADWDTRMKDGTPPSDPCRPTGTPADTPAPIVAELRPLQSQDCDFDSRNIATLTLRSNPSNKPIENERIGAREENRLSSSQTKERNGLSKTRVRKPSSFNGSRAMVASMSHGEVAEQAAAKRLNADLLALGRDAYADVLERITPDLTDAATRAEVAARGGGVRLVIRHLGRSGVGGGA